MILLVFVSLPEMKFLRLPESPPVKLAFKLGIPQLYLVLSGTTPLIMSLGDTSNVTPLHTVVLISVIYPPGLTVTTTVNAAP